MLRCYLTFRLRDIIYEYRTYKHASSVKCQSTEENSKELTPNHGSHPYWPYPFFIYRTTFAKKQITDHSCTSTVLRDTVGHASLWQQTAKDQSSTANHVIWTIYLNVTSRAREVVLNPQYFKDTSGKQRWLTTATFHRQLPDQSCHLYPTVVIFCHYLTDMSASQYDGWTKEHRKEIF